MIRDNWDDVYFPENIGELIHKDTDEKMVDHIRRANADYLDTLALTYMGIQITYRELFSHVEEYARSLKQFGLQKGDYITVCLPNCPEAVYYFYACNEIGVTPYLIDPRFTVGKMGVCVQDSQSKLFVCEMGTYYSKVAQYEDTIPVDRIIVVSPLFSFEVHSRLSFRQKALKCLYSIKSASEKRKAPNSQKRCYQKEFIEEGKKWRGEITTEYDSSIPAIVVNTSGTSGGSVKGASHTNKSYNILANQTDFISSEIRRGYDYYGYIPYFTMYGSAVGMHTGLTHGVIIDNIPQFNGKKSLLEIVQKKPNILIGVPSLFENLAAYCKRKSVDMSFAKLYVMGGDNVSPEKLQKENELFAQLGMQKKITYGYGSTEVMMASTTSDDERSYQYGSCGIPYPGVCYKVLEPDTQVPLENGSEGEIYIHTETLMAGYLNKPEESKAVFTEIDGVRYFKTGDKGYLTETGHLFFTGRYKRLMKRPDGHQVTPIPIENAISKHPIVEDCCVVGLRKNKEAQGVIPTAFIKARADIAITETEIKDIAEKSLQLLSGEREIALTYRIVDFIPYTENGKMNYRALEERSFSDGTYYAIDDPITRGYFKGMENVKIIKL